MTDYIRIVPLRNMSSQKAKDPIRLPSVPTVVPEVPVVEDPTTAIGSFSPIVLYLGSRTNWAFLLIDLLLASQQ